MLRAREPKLLNADRAGRMLDAASYEEAAKLLTDCGYEDMSQMSAKEVEAAINSHRAEIFAELDRLAPEKDIIDIFRMKYDYHNAKVLVKAEATGADSENLFSDVGRISGEKLKALYEEGKFSSMPGKLGSAVEEAKLVLARTSNPQQSDFVLDKAYFGEMLEKANECGNVFLEGYAKTLIDAANLKIAVRTMRMNKNQDFLKSVLIPGGFVDKDRIAAAGDRESLAGLYAHGIFEDAALKGAEAAAGGRQTEFELACDNAVNGYLKSAKLVSFGSEPLTAYLAALENEVTAVRMILTGRLAGIKSGTIKERLRDLYA